MLYAGFLFVSVSLNVIALESQFTPLRLDASAPQQLSVMVFVCLRVFVPLCPVARACVCLWRERARACVRARLRACARVRARSRVCALCDPDMRFRG